MSLEIVPETIVDFTSPVSVSTLTVLQAFKNYGSVYSSLLFALINTGVTNNANFLIETSEDGTYADMDSYTLVVYPQKQASLEVGQGLLRRYWRLSVNTDSPSFPTTTVKWCIRGITRG